MIRRISPFCIGLTVTLASLSALAQDEGTPETVPATDAPADGTAGAVASTDDGGGKIHLGLRLGYGIPMGEAAKDSNLNDAVSGMIPIWLDLGYFVTPNIMVGLYAQYGILMIPDAEAGSTGGCPDGADCSGSDLRFGLQGQYHLSPGESLNPWFGLGIGYEILSTSFSAGGTEADGSFKGLEFLNLQAGADFKVADSVGIGPFVSFSLGQYSSGEVNVPGVGQVDGDIEEKGLHQWLVIGVKGSFGF